MKYRPLRCYARIARSCKGYGQGSQIIVSLIYAQATRLTDLQVRPKVALFTRKRKTVKHILHVL